MPDAHYHRGRHALLARLLQKHPPQAVSQRGPGTADRDDHQQRLRFWRGSAAAQPAPVAPDWLRGQPAGAGGGEAQSRLPRREPSASKPCSNRSRSTASADPPYVLAIRACRHSWRCWCSSACSPRGFAINNCGHYLRSSSACKPEDLTRGRMSYDLRRLRLHGLIERIKGSHRYRLTPAGLKVALFYSRTYQHVIRPGLSLLHSPQESESFRPGPQLSPASRPKCSRSCKKNAPRKI